RFGKWLPHVTVAAITGEASTISPGAVSCAQSSGGCDITPMGGPGVVPAGTPLMNFPISIQTSVTYGLRYELNDSAALKIEHSVVDVENDAVELAGANQQFNFGLFDSNFQTMNPPGEKVGVTSIALDVIF
ncbi:MAG: hypothetical protein OEZ15_10405, partial [Gammaproteobacteria bacterium]|nr:hypothetical protein [Gammaproteobacteria bacterium]